MRIIKSEQAWWALSNGTAARIPQELAPLTAEELPDEVMAALAASMREESGRDSYFLTVLTSTNCNLSCHYCFQNETVPVAGALPLRIAGATIDEATIDRALEFAGRQMRTHGKSGLRIMLFGGEPLLAPDACCHLLDRAASLQLKQASMISNGVLLDGRLAQRLDAAGLSSVQVTLDGDRESHDGIRHTKGGRATYDTIVNNVAEVRRTTGIEVYVRVNLSATSAARLAPLVKELTEVLPPEKVHVALALVRDPGIGFADLVAKNNELADSMIDAYVELAKAGFQVPVPADPDCATCGEVGGSGGAVINADGTLYSCWETAGKPGWDVGDVGTGFIADERLESRWVACGYSSADPESAGDVRDFHTMLDGALLDALYREGVLHRLSAGPDMVS